jgi:hypothetical protein
MSLMRLGVGQQMPGSGSENEPSVPAQVRSIRKESARTSV